LLLLGRKHREKEAITGLVLSWEGRNRRATMEESRRRRCISTIHIVRVDLLFFFRTRPLG
jgi:hypothetical protein